MNILLFSKSILSAPFPFEQLIYIHITIQFRKHTLGFFVVGLGGWGVGVVGGKVVSLASLPNPLILAHKTRKELVKVK